MVYFRFGVCINFNSLYPPIYLLWGLQLFRTMFLKKIAYWGAGFACGILIYVIGWFVDNNYSFYTNRPHPGLASEVRSNLLNIYLACKAYWAETEPANACDLRIASLTTYGYIQSRDVVIWGEYGNANDFSVKGKHHKLNRVFKLEHKEIVIRDLAKKELESALAEFNKLEGNNKTP